jgi:hypothetical protein
MYSILHDSFADPDLGSGAFLPPGILDPGSRIRNPYFESLATIFGKKESKILKELATFFSFPVQNFSILKNLRLQKR